MSEIPWEIARWPVGNLPFDQKKNCAGVEQASAHQNRRPLKLVRHVGSRIFYHKQRLPPIPEHMHTLRIEKRER